MMRSAHQPTTLPGVRNVVDLSFPVRDHFRWAIETDLVHDLAAGDVFQTTRMRTVCHAFTHADAPLHVAADGQDIASVPLGTWIGAAAVLDLTHVEEETAITAQTLEAAGAHLQRGDIALLRTDWDARMDVETRAFWERSPYLTRDAAEWLADREVRCVGYDFPQDHPIRGVVDGSPSATAAEFVTHDVLLRHGVGMVEYLAGLRQLEATRTFFVAVPLRLVAVDGSPVRAFALEFEPTAATGA
jgi:arylformamidase